MQWAARRTRAVYFACAAVLVLALGALNLMVDPAFVQPAYLAGTFAAFAPLALAAIASTPAILSGGGGIDISIGPLMSFVNVVLVVQVIPASGVWSQSWVGFCAAVTVGAVVGCLSGVLVTRLRYQAILATLCLVFVLTGAALKLAPTPSPLGTLGPTTSPAT